ncbi:MAG TPA: hypothetical protein VL443_09100, partial [Cyclobacteriaceae bacterium]|nr:hypothetical protein [Cyclobacteriaceae bacterium]
MKNTSKYIPLNSMDSSFFKMALSIILSAFITQGAMAQLSDGEKSTINSMLPQPVPKSPNVAALGKFSDYPVNYFSGVPEISIPIFEITSGELSVPITLSYHASGIKPSDVASWVGLGWSLSAGGNVSRNVLGKRDEEDFYTRTLIPSPNGCIDYTYLKQSALSTIDTQPDVFSYSFPGGSGKFMFTGNGNPDPYLIPYAPYIIKPTFASNAFTKFEITNEHGVLHRFGTSSTQATSQEFTSSVTGGNPTLGATTAWHLMEMVSPNTDDQISFTYQDAGMCTMSDISYYETVQDQCQIGNSTCPDSQPLIPQSASINTAVNQQAVSVITYKNGKVEFVMGDLRSDQTQLHSLDYINIYSLVNGQYTLLKTIKFIYSYFTIQGNNARLKLDALQFLDSNGALVQNYKFSYFSTDFPWTSSYGYPINARDLWGYYNGAVQNTDLILKKSIYFLPNGATTGAWTTIGGADDRSVNVDYIKNGVLKRIDFPTGGYTEFDFEANQYYNYYDAPGTPTLAGGLRVASITSSAGSDTPSVVKIYKYGSGGNYTSGVGVANFSQYSYNYKSVQSLVLKACDAQMPSYKYMSTTYYSNSAYNTDNFDSSPVIYPNVTEYFGDPAGNNIGRTEYEYDNGYPQTDNDQIVPPSNKYYRDSYFWKRGKLTHSVTYDNSNNKLSEKTIEYTGLQTNDKIVSVGAFQYNIYLGPYCDISDACILPSGDYVDPSDFSFTSFYQHSGAWLETKTTSKTYNYGDVNNYVMTEVSKTYDPTKLQPIQTTNTGSNKDQVVTINKYPFDLTTSPAARGNVLGIQMLNTKNIISSPIETFTYRQNTDGSNSRVIAGQLTTYRQNDANTNYVVPDQIYLWESPQPMPADNYGRVSTDPDNSSLVIDPNQKPRINMLGYDSYGNVLSVAKTNDVTVSYFYGYNHSLPIAEVKDALNTTNAQEIFYESFEESNSASVITNASLSHAGKNYFNGAYTTTFAIPNSKSYKLEYWYLANGKWSYNTKTYT